MNRDNIEERLFQDFYQKKYEKHGLNTASIALTTEEPISPDKMLEIFDIDTDVWMIDDDNVVCKAWSVHAKSKAHDLTWDKDGKVHGWSRSDGEMTGAWNFGTTVPLKRIVPIELFPTIKPILAQWDKPKGRKPKKKIGDLRRCLHICDPHFGFARNTITNELQAFHDRRALDIVLQVVKSEPFDEILIHGDILDLAEWTDHFIVQPEFFNTTMPAIVEAAWWLKQIREAQPHADIKLLEGNHEVRMGRAILKNLRAARDLRRADQLELPPALSVPSLLSLDALDIEWVGGYPDNKVWLTDGICCIHGENPKADSGATVTNLAKKRFYTIIQGDIHRVEMATRTITTGRDEEITYTIIAYGWLGRKEFVPGGDKEKNWQQAFGITTYSEASDIILPMPVYIQHGQAIYNGEILEGADRDEELNEIIQTELGKIK